MNFMNGMTWGWSHGRDEWMTPEGEQSFEKMIETGVNSVTLAFWALQEHPQSTEILFRESPTVTDEEIRWAVAKAKSHGLHVCLKPVVNCKNGVWRAHISFFEQEVPGEPSWRDWFVSYTEFMLHYAALAEELGCEMLCIGCEMVQMDRNHYADKWRELIQQVREVYHGLLTYNCDKYQEDHITWWDAVDVISASGYYPIGDWASELSRIEPVVKRYDKPFLFFEAGCPSRRGSGARPNDWNLVGEPDEEEQAAFYREMFSECAQRPWVRGFALWDWPVQLYAPEEASQNDDYCMYGKSAERVVHDFYVHGSVDQVKA
jgi:hypothetical protein